MEKEMSEGPKKEFLPPRHWLDPLELNESYWTNAAVQERRAQEFYEKPIEAIEKIDELDREGLARRDFLTVMGASIAMASLSCARRPVHQIIPYVVKPEEVTPGVPTWYASTCSECSSGCGVLVKNREGRPIKLEGNPDHPVSRGALCAKGQASLLNLYDPDRLKKPQSRSRVHPDISRALSWEEADSEIITRLNLHRAKIRLWTDKTNSPSTQALIKEFLLAFPSSKHVEFNSTSLEEIQQGQYLSYGESVVPHYRFDRASLIVSLGADFLGNWISPVEHARDWSQKRKLFSQNPSGAVLSRLICFEPTFTVTGANADERYPIRPEDEIKVALALIYEILINQKKSSFSNDLNVKKILAGYSPELISEEIGLPKKLFSQLANELWKHRGHGLVVAGGLASKTVHSVSLQVAVNFLNSILENEGVTVDAVNGSFCSNSGFEASMQLLEEMKAGEIDLLIIHGINPFYSFPSSVFNLEKAFDAVGCVIRVSSHLDETARFSDYVLPDHHFLESWGDAHPRRGVFSLQQPTIAPLYESRSFQDSLLKWIKSSQDWHTYLRKYWKKNLYSESDFFGDFEQFWESCLRTGVLVKKEVPAVRRKFNVSSLKQLPMYSQRTSKESFVLLSLYEKISMGDGRSANNAWLQEMPDPITAISWDNYLNVSPSLAKKQGLKENDVVEVQLNALKVKLPVHIQPGMHSDVVSAAIGYGRSSVGKVGDHAGVNLFPFVFSQGGRLVFSGGEVSLRKTGKFYQLASTQWHTAAENRPVINDITLSQFRANPTESIHTDPHLRMDTVPSLWSKHEYQGYRWGMAIDLNSCTGCGACVIACQSENNIPVVGREQVRASRQMHWIRIDRYYSGNLNQPDVVFQPMLCQHCENAPCETVCPVVATLHDSEGLNVQIYNRCVGTRYCQNNCPYKVRRFNFFDHWKNYDQTMNLSWNPDVTVRTRGVIEKCSFCTQRIREAKEKAKDMQTGVQDGAFKTACQQTCPTEAIVFGNINDPKSRVSQLQAAPQAFRALEVLNTKPSISYLTKVRNKEQDQKKGHAHVS